MTYRRWSVVIVGAALLSAVGGGAWAADKVIKPVDFTVKSEPLAAAPRAGNVVQWDARLRRFGFTVDVQQPGERPVVPNDVSAGAYFRITPKLRVGGSVALGEQDLTVRANRAPPATQPKVRVETKLKF
jgi:hypothetical protein